MAARCEFCRKAPMFGNNVSHANNATKRRWNLNLHRVRIVIDGRHRRARVCAACIRSGRIVKSH